MTNQRAIDKLWDELEALRESTRKYRLLIEATDMGFAILDRDGRVLEANAEYVKLTGYERLEQILGRPVGEWTAPADRERSAAEIGRCLAEGGVRSVQVDYLGPNEQRIPIEIKATVQQAQAGPTILTICRDTKVGRQAEAALHNSEQRYRATIDSMGEAIHVVNAELRIELVNRTGKQWCKQFGINGEIVGRHVFEVFPFLPDSVRDEYRRVFAGAGTLITEETNLVLGQEVSTETRKIPIVEDGRVVRVVTVLRDVTAIVRAQEKLRQTEKLDALGQLASGIAHDFNNQLGAVLGYAELLRSRTDDPQLKEYASDIVEVVHHSADLIRQLLTFGRKGRARSVPVDMHALIREVAEMLERTIDPRISIVLQLHAERAVTTGDPAQLESALLNLALNARDAMPRGGTLTFSTDVPPPVEHGAEPRLRVRVSDTGVGMSEQVRRRLFEPFFTTKGPGHGNGMGLAAVYGTITEHQGTIHVESEPDRGAMFTLLLPSADDDHMPEERSTSESPTRGSGHILVVDDRAPVLRAVSEGLTSLGYRVTTRDDGAAAVQCYRESWQDFDVVMLDARMPRLDGASALAEMRRINPDVRAILCSGHPPSPKEQRLVDELGVRFLQKPFTLAELSKCTAGMLGGAGS